MQEHSPNTCWIHQSNGAEQHNRTLFILVPRSRLSVWCTYCKGGSGEYSTKILSTEEFVGNNVIGSLANYLVCTGFCDHILTHHTFTDLLLVYWSQAIVWICTAVFSLVCMYGAEGLGTRLDILLFPLFWVFQKLGIKVVWSACYNHSDSGRPEGITTTACTLYGLEGTWLLYQDQRHPTVVTGLPCIEKSQKHNSRFNMTLCIFV